MELKQPIFRSLEGKELNFGGKIHKNLILDSIYSSNSRISAAFIMEYY